MAGVDSRASSSILTMAFLGNNCILLPIKYTIFFYGQLQNLVSFVFLPSGSLITVLLIVTVIVVVTILSVYVWKKYQMLRAMLFERSRSNLSRLIDECV